MSSERSLWWYTGATDEGKDVLIFDPGHESSDLHVYTHEKSIHAEDVQQMANEELGKSHDRASLAEDLAELEFGESNGKRYSIED
jgi:butyrate kinase